MTVEGNLLASRDVESLEVAKLEVVDEVDDEAKR